MPELRVDFAQLQRKIKESKPAIREDVKRAVDLATQRGAQIAREGPWKDRTGQLRSTLSANPGNWVTGYMYQASFQTRMPYAAYLEFGTKAHWILPVKARALRWETPDGKVHFASRVWHPGTTPLNFMLHARLRAEYLLVNDLHHNFPSLRAVWRGV